MMRSNFSPSATKKLQKMNFSHPSNTELRKSVENLKHIPRNENNPQSINQETIKSETLQKRSIRENSNFSEQVILYLMY